MQTTLTVRISDNGAQTLDGLCASTGKSRSDFENYLHMVPDTPAPVGDERV